MNILVPLHQGVDPLHAHRLKPNGASLDSTGMEHTLCAFDSYALEAALRLTENGQHVKQRLGAVTILTCGSHATEGMLRSALALGADSAVRLDVQDDPLDGDLVARALAAWVQEAPPDLILLGKQSTEADSNQVAQLLAAYLDWPHITCATALCNQDEESLQVEKTLDHGTLTVQVHLPAVVSVDLRIVQPRSVQSRHTAPDYAYPEGVRFASLMNLVAAKKKPLLTRSLADLVEDTHLKVEYVSFSLPPPRNPGIQVRDVQELVHRLRHEVQVL